VELYVLWRFYHYLFFGFASDLQWLPCNYLNKIDTSARKGM